METSPANAADVSELSDDARFPLTSADPNAARIAALKALFPDAFTEGKLDTERLKAALGENIADGKERYELSWAGKSDARRALQTLSVGTLTPDRAESVNFDATENLIIEGDNLEVLKLLQRSYQNKIKMIYIDPPYNKDKDFIYPDRWSEGLTDYLRFSGQLDDDDNLKGKIQNPEGRIHSKWLSMMYPRLFLARNLLRNDGIIFVSIDDSEIHNLRALMDEVFEPDNLLAQIVWDLGTGTAAGHFTRSHEYILAYARDKKGLSNFQYDGPSDSISERAIKKISKANPASPITFPAGIAFEGDNATFEGEVGDKEICRIVGGKMEFVSGRLAAPVTVEAGWAMKNQILSWLSGDETFDSKGQKVTRFFFDKKGRLQYEKQRGVVNPASVLRNIASTRKGAEQIEELFGFQPLEFPKPVDLIQTLVRLS